MSTKQKITVLTNIYNEEYLLPFWLEHHKNMFDEGIIIDYRSTDRSVEICKKICPNWKIITTRNSHFGAVDIDKEFMEIESTIDGIKMVLNTTEFLFIDRPINELFDSHGKDNVSLSIKQLSPYSANDFYPENLSDLLKRVLNDDVVFNDERGDRQLHNFAHGNYSIGRHGTHNPHTKITEAHIIWFGMFPLNEMAWKRKLQIKENIPESDKASGFGFHHLFDKSTMMTNHDKSLKNGVPLKIINNNLFNTIKTILDSQVAPPPTQKVITPTEPKTFVVTGGCGFIGSHMVDKLCELGNTVIVIDNLLSGTIDNLNKEAIFFKADICEIDEIKSIFKKFKIDGIFHFAAIARTPWCIDDPILAYNTNVMGTLNILECARQYNIKRVVLSSSNVVYAFLTPYRTSKEAVEDLGHMYNKMYNLSTISLRYSNVYGKRQSETGPSPNVFAALRKSKKECGYLTITGDGTQTRNYTHVSDIVNGNLLAMFSDYCGTIDLCTGISVPLNEAASYFNCPIVYTEERPGDIKHIIQSPDDAFNILGWKANVSLNDGIKDVL